MLAALAVSACADGGSPASAACPGITARCGGICVDLSTDRDHCGECGHACTELGKGCFAGQCTSPAPMGRPRALHAVAVASDGRMYAIGGHDDTFAPTTRVEAYDPATNRWSEVKPMTVPRTVLSAVAQGDRVLAIGGTQFGDLAVDRVDAYDPNDNGWSSPPKLQVARADAAAVTDLAGVTHVLWGWNVWVAKNSDEDDGGPAWSLASMESLEQGGDWMLEGTVDGPPPRWGARPVLGPNGKIHLLGGYRSHWVPLGSTTDDVSIYDGATWTHGASMPLRRALGAAVAGPDGLIYYFGGIGDRGGIPPSSDVQVYDPVGDRWALAPAPLPLPQRDMAAATLSDGRIYVVGGLVYLPDGITSGVVVYDPKRGEWYW